MVELTERQKEIVSNYANQFIAFLKTSDGLEGQKERKEKRAFLKRVLSKENLNVLTKDKFGKVIKSLWASDFWGNKEYLVNKIFSDNGLPKLRSELEELLYGNNPLDTRYDRFRRNIKGLGPSSITEILAFVLSDKCGLWTKSPKNVLPFLGMKTLLPDRVYKYSINGRDYVKCNEVLGLIKNEVSLQSELKDVDFIDVDFFMWFVFSEVMERQAKSLLIVKEEMKPPISEEIKIAELTHWDVMGILVELGNLLGFDTYVADPSRKYKNNTLGQVATLREIPGFTYQDTLDIVKNIDVIWFKGEYPEHCFEVEHTTNIRDGLLRLYQVSPLRGIKFFIIAPSENAHKFKKEVARRPFKEIKNRYNFRSYRELIKWFEEAKIYHKLERGFLGLLVR